MSASELCDDEIHGIPPSEDGRRIPNLTLIYRLLRFLKDNNAIEGAKEKMCYRLMLEYYVLRRGPIANYKSLRKYLGLMLKLGLVTVRKKYGDYQLTKLGLDWCNGLREYDKAVAGEDTQTGNSWQCTDRRISSCGSKATGHPSRH